MISIQRMIKSLKDKGLSINKLIKRSNNHKGNRNRIKLENICGLVDYKSIYNKYRSQNLKKHRILILNTKITTIYVT